MAELLWVNTSATRDSTSDTHARHVIRAQAMRYHHSQQKRQRQQRHTDYMLQQVKQCGIPELSIDGTDKRADERLLRPDYHVGTLTSPDHDSQERASVRSSLDRDLDAPKRSGRPSAQKSPRRSDRSAKQVHVQRLLCSPSTWGRETPDPFSSPVQVSRMFGVCKVCKIDAILSQFLDTS